jgi:hypothetical protein
MGEFVPSNSLGKRCWMICPRCGRRNWMARKNHPGICLGCKQSLPDHSWWPEQVRRAIIERDGGCIFQDFPVAWMGPCRGRTEVAHVTLRQHGGLVASVSQGAVVCQRHLDELLLGRGEARQAYRVGDQAAFGVWLGEHRHIPPSKLPKRLMLLRVFLAGVVYERTRRWKAEKRLARKRAKRKSRKG